VTCYRAARRVTPLDLALRRRFHHADTIQSTEFSWPASSAAAAYWVAGHAGIALSNSPNEQLNIAGIGVGGKGRSDIDHAGKFGNVAAICDIDEVRLATSTMHRP
jgi:hypothetical protein